MIKTFVLTVADVFPTTHPDRGNKTHFSENIFSGKKIHTIRMNYPYWAERMDDVKNGKAIISLRKWSGRPYRSKQDEFQRITKDNNPDVQRIFIPSDPESRIIVDGDDWARHLIAANDGLTLDQFNAWFKKGSVVDSALIHFTDFRYRL